MSRADSSRHASGSIRTAVILAALADMPPATYPAAAVLQGNGFAPPVPVRRAVVRRHTIAEIARRPLPAKRTPAGVGRGHTLFGRTSRNLCRPATCVVLRQSRGLRRTPAGLFLHRTWAFAWRFKGFRHIRFLCSHLQINTANSFKSPLSSRFRFPVSGPIPLLPKPVQPPAASKRQRSLRRGFGPCAVRVKVRPCQGVPG